MKQHPILFLHFCFLLLFSCSIPEQPLTRKEVIDFARMVQKFAAVKDIPSLNKIIDKETFIAKMNLPSTPGADGFKKGLASRLNFGDLIFQQSKSTSFEFINYYEKEGVHHAVFRYLGGQSELNYFDCIVEKIKDSCRISDFYLYTTGEDYTETMRTFYLESGLDEEAKKDILTMKESDLYRVQRMRYFVSKKEFENARQEFELMSLTTQQLRLMQLQNIQISSRISNEAHLAAINNFKRLYPDDKRTGLLLMDGYYLNGEYSKVLECINELDSSIKGDPYLHLYRYNVYTQMGEHSKALQSLEKLVAEMPQHQEGILELINAYLEKKDYAKTDIYVKTYQSTQKFNQEKLEMLLQSYPGYIRKAN